MWHLVSGFFKVAFIGAFVLTINVPAFAGSQVTATKAALSTVSPQATQIGLAVLKNGGNAIDAAVAVSFALAVSHPQAGNLAGGGFLVYYEAATKGVWTLDYREVAPSAAKRDMYLQPDGNASKRSQTGALASGIPGTIAGLEAMHERFGTKPWQDLVTPAVRLAREGFVVDTELSFDLSTEQKNRALDQFQSTAALFFPDGKPLRAGTTFIQNDLAETIERIGAFGPREFYTGATATKLVEAVRAGGGIFGFRDLADYKPVWRAPILIHFRDYDIYTMAPPSAGGLILGEALSILNGYDLASLGFGTADAIHLEAEAERRAYIDRVKYLGDPATTRIPYRDLLSEERAKLWRASIDPKRVTPTATLTEPGTTIPESNHTTHFTIVDEQGNIASITTTLNDNFGSGFVVPGLGFFLNNEMDDFTTAPGKENLYHLIQGTVNAIEPGKKMASSMTPAIVLKNGKPFVALGTRGGATIPTSILQVLINMIVYQKPLYEAIAAPRYHHQGQPEDIFYERDRFSQKTIDGLLAMGHGVRDRESIGDIHAVAFVNGKLVAVADPRHLGSAGGY